MSMKLTRGNADEEWCHGFPNISVIVNKYCWYKPHMLLSQHAVPPFLLTPMWNACIRTNADYWYSTYSDCELWTFTPVCWGQCYWHSVLPVFYGDSSVGVAIRYGLGGLGIDSRWGVEIFRSRPDRPWGPTSILYNAYWGSFLGGKAAGGGVDHPPHLSPTLRKE